MSLLTRFTPKGASGFGHGTTAEEVLRGLDLRGRKVLITGASSGIGLETARVLAAAGALVACAGRSREKVARALHGLPGALEPFECDLTRPASVRACVAEVAERGLALDVVICNAGIMAPARLEQAFGYELQFFTNHIGHFILVTEILEHVSDAARIVIVGSDAHRRAPAGGIEWDNLSGERNYRPIRAYGQSKLANLLFARELSRRLAGTRRTANALHPGVIVTNLQRSLPRVATVALRAVAPFVLKDVAQGAATSCYVAAHPDIEGVSGAYFADCNRTRPSRLAEDDALAARLWVESERIVSGLPE